MDLENIEDLINKEKITLINTYLKNSYGAYIEYNNIKAILYNNRTIENSNRKKQVLLEELRSLLYERNILF